MNTAGILDTLRALHADVMVDECTITRATVGTLNETTGAYPEAVTEVYSGPCRVKHAEPAAASTVDAAGIAVDMHRPTMDLPWTATGVVAPGDDVTVTSGPLSGTTAEVYAEVVGTTSTSRRYTLEVQS